MHVHYLHDNLKRLINNDPEIISNVNNFKGYYLQSL